MSDLLLFNHSPEAREIINTYDVNIGGILADTYTQISQREIRGCSGSIDAIANGGFCYDMTTLVTPLLNHALKGKELQAYITAHEVDMGVDMDHLFTVIPHPSGDPMRDTVIDGTYKQFIEVGHNLPHAFIGSRAAIVEEMQGLSPYYELYRPEYAFLNPRIIRLAQACDSPYYMPNRTKRLDRIEPFPN